MGDTQPSTGSYEARSIRANLVMVLWVFIWMASMVVADKGALYAWWSAQWITVLAIAVNVLLGLSMIVAFMRLLQGMDDLQRKIQLEALSIALGVSLVGSAAYSLLVSWGFILDEDVSDIFVLMCVSYSVSVLIGTVRYR